VPRTRRHAALAAVAAVVLAGTAGCSGDDDPGQAEDEPTSTTSAPSSPTESTGESSPAAPSVTPASGIELTEASSTVRAPAEWEPMDEIVDYASAASDASGRNSVDLVDSGDLSGGASLDTQAASAIKTLPKGAHAARQPDVMLDGVAAFHIHYTVAGDRSEYDTITTVRNGRNVGLDFVLEKKNAATNPDLIESVLATFAWTA
jgi:hypothetical protein